MRIEQKPEDTVGHDANTVDESQVPARTDPLHDIDEKKTITWLVRMGSDFPGHRNVWLMIQLFDYMAFNERVDKIAVKDPMTRLQLRLQAAEPDKEVAGKDGHKSIDQATEDYLR